MNTRPECPLVRERLPALSENDLSPGETLLVRAHLEGCPNCRGAADELELLISDFQASRPDTGDYAAAQASLRAVLDAEPRRHGLRPRILALAAAALVLAGLTWTALDPPSTSLRELSLASRTLAGRLELPSLDWPRLDHPQADDSPGEDR